MTTPCCINALFLLNCDVHMITCFPHCLGHVGDVLHRAASTDPGLTIPTTCGQVRPGGGRGGRGLHARAHALMHARTHHAHACQHAHYAFQSFIEFNLTHPCIMNTKTPLLTTLLTMLVRVYSRVLNPLTTTHLKTPPSCLLAEQAGHMHDPSPSCRST